MLISIYNEDLDKWEVKEFDALTVDESIIETHVMSYEERRKYGDRIIKAFSNSPHYFQFKENKDSVPRETSNFTKEFLAKCTNINVNAVIHALQAGQTPYQIIEQLVQQLDNVQKWHNDLVEYVGEYVGELQKLL